jgi:hypothetical protein
VRTRWRTVRNSRLCLKAHHQSATRVKVANPKQLDLFGQLFEDVEGSDAPIV